MLIPSFKLPKLPNQLPDWSEDSFKPYKQAVKKLGNIAIKAGRGSDRFQQISIKILASKDQFNIRQIQQPIDVRAFVLALHDDAFCDKVKLTESRLMHLDAIRSPLSKLSLMNLISAYFKQYDKLASGKDWQFLCEFIAEQLQAQFVGKGKLPNNDLALFYQYRSLIFGENPPLTIVQKAKNEHKDLNVVFNEIGLGRHLQGELVIRTNLIYYLETLREIPVGADDPILAEVIKEEVYNAKFDGRGKLLGHCILEILIDRSAEKNELSVRWRDVIMMIAGDPRVPSTSHNYQHWWRMLGEKRIQQMQMWLNRFNLQLFLRILEQSAVEQDKHDMLRMFEVRKDFMMGLDNQKFIRNSRLFLTNDATRYLYRHYQRNQLPNFANVTGAASVIYLELTNGQHIVEGTHSFSIKLMNHLPQSIHIMDYHRSHFYDDNFRKGLEHQYKREYGNVGLWAERHDVYLNWFHRITSALKNHGLPLDISQMLNRENYRYYRQRFGAF